MNRLKDIVTNKPIVLGSDATLKEALNIMNQNKLGCVVLLDSTKAVGIITESDIINTLKENLDLSQKAISIAKQDLVKTDENRPVEFAFELLSQYNIKRLIIVNKENDFIGVVLQEDLLKYLESDVYKVDLKISSILEEKNSVVTVDINDSIKDVLIKMQTYKIGSVIVLHDTQYVGIVTEKDIIKVTYDEVNLSNKISLYMTSPIITVSDDTFVLDAMNIMQMKNIRRVVVVDSNNKLLSILTNRDILKHIKGNYTRILQNKVKHAQEIMNFLPEPIIEVYYSSDNDIVYWMNTQAIKIFGKNLVDQDITKIMKKEDWKYIKNLLLESTIINNISVKIASCTYQISGTISKNTSSNYIKLIFKDVTNYEIKNEELQNIVDKEIKKRLESEYLMMQQAKLATMGEMIGHIAHQWRQPLAKLGGIFMNIESAYLFGDLDKKYLMEKLNNGNKLIKYMSTTIDDFRNFFEPNKEKEIFNVYTYIQNALNLINASLTYRHITINLNNIDDTLCSVGYPSEFSQVILNVLANAEDTIIAREVQNGVIDISIQSLDKDVVIKIQDNAGGISLENIDKIFDIYFTTKQRKEGSGLGLYMSKLIIETKLGGTIGVQNHNDGALFTLILPKN